MQIHTFPFGPLQANLYLVIWGCDAIIIDPCVPLESFKQSGIKIRGIFCTHAHFDHIFEAESLRTETGSRIYAYETECSKILDPDGLDIKKLFPSRRILPPIIALTNGQVFSSKDFSSDEKEDFTFKIIHTPGHSTGSMCLLFEENTTSGVKYSLFSGDTIFAGTVGRTDLGGSMRDMMRSVRIISKLPDDTNIYPGHGSATTLREEKRSNPYFTALNDNDII